MVLLILTGSLSIMGVSGAFHTRTDLKQDTDEVLRCVRLARETAITCGCDIHIRTARRTHPSSGQRCVVVELLAQPSPYSGAVDASNASHFGLVSTNPSEWMVDPIWLASTTRLNADTNEIVFQSDGTSTQDANWSLSNGGESYSIRVESVTGNILLGGSP
ncbi:GspH/FimT family pseudopilin [Neorhodopirellula pilleata]|nr:GspH/FimT family pseudopilin [Neorhodopirellula pilleata]